MNILGLALILACAPTALLDFAIPKWKADKSTRVEDAYKYLYQATRGGEHAAPSKEAARNWLDNEWQDLGGVVNDESAWEPLCPDGSIGRLNLRPFKNEGGKAEDLLGAFLRSARGYRSEPEAFVEAWNELDKRLKKQSFGNISHKEWKRLDAEMKKKKYPAIHHSDDYNKANRPAYRVLTLEQVHLLIPS